jgi:NADP-dependent 3-hydroxy acid dehydrogenase YdfG
MDDKKVWLITGTSSGFGRALAEAVLERGDKVVLTARKTEAVEDLATRYENTALPVRLDVTNANERRESVEVALGKFGRIDVLVNNAGQGSLGALEEFSSEQICRQFDVNCFGTIEMTRELLPVMRRQRSGHILNVTSIGGLAAVGGFALYCATKFAVEGFSEGLRDEVKPLGINVTIVEPGAFRTDFAGDSNMRPEQAIAEYNPVVEPIRPIPLWQQRQATGRPPQSGARDDRGGRERSTTIALDARRGCFRVVGEEARSDGWRVRTVARNGYRDLVRWSRSFTDRRIKT